MKKYLWLLTFISLLTMVFADGNFTSPNMMADTEYTSWFADTTDCIISLPICLVKISTKEFFSSSITQEEVDTQKRLSDSERDPLIDEKENRSDLQIARDRFYDLLDIYSSMWILLGELFFTSIFVLEIYLISWFCFNLIIELFIKLIDYIQKRKAQ